MQKRRGITINQHDQVTNSLRITTFREILLSWYTKNGRTFPWRKPSASKYQVIIAEVLLQRTRADVIANFLPGFIKKYPSWNKLSRASIDDLQRELHPIGLWKRRATSINALSQELVKLRGRFPRDRGQIEALPGVGQYITNAILLFCHGEPQPLLDGNMARVLERVFGPRTMADIRYDPYLQKLALDIVQCKTPKEVNWAILDLAATICLGRKPVCENCPLSSMCDYYHEEKMYSACD